MKPATPLPWAAEHIGVSDAGPDGDDVFDIGPVDSEGYMRRRVATVTGNDAAYIVAACTVYPKLVEALKEILGRFDDHDLKLTVDAIQASRGVLRELGEIE